MDKEREKVLKYVLRHACKLGATLGTWLDSDMKFTNRAAHSALEAMMQHFVDEINLRFGEIEREEDGRCRLCGKKEQPPVEG